MSNRVPLTDDHVSRRHAVIRTQEGGCSLVDFGSRNGTCVNDRRIAQPTRRPHGAVVRIGPFQFVFRHPADTQPVHITKLLSGRTVSDMKLERCWMLGGGHRGFHAAAE